MAFTLTDLASDIDDQFITNADGTGFDNVGQCRAVNNNNNNNNGDGNGYGDGDDSESVPEEPQCCGTYPQRFEFFSRDGARACCGDKTYNTDKHDCCDGGFLAQIGSCAANL